MRDPVTGRPSHRPFTACGSYKNKRAADSAARQLSTDTETWEAVPLDKLRRSGDRLYAIRRSS